MAENQIQIVINPRDFIGDKDPISGFGPNKDFFSGEDDAFVAHKSMLVNQLAVVGAASRQNPYSLITYAKVKMRSNAIAKTHRPTKSIFSYNKPRFLRGHKKRGYGKAEKQCLFFLIFGLLRRIFLGCFFEFFHSLT